MFSEYEGIELPEELRNEVEKRLISAFPTRINALNGATVLAATSMLNSSDVFIGKGLTHYTVYIYIFEAGTPISVTFIPGSDNVVSANSSFIINDILKEIESGTDLKEWLREYANLSDCDVSEVQEPRI
ncbi:MAG: hypothetical protein VB111_01895 [Clostridiaceae bacterium]|nr:hypothetical protein [Clostridiaceae bacterium]